MRYISVITAILLMTSALWSNDLYKNHQIVMDLQREFDKEDAAAQAEIARHEKVTLAAEAFMDELEVQVEKEDARRIAIMKSVEMRKRAEARKWAEGFLNLCIGTILMMIIGIFMTNCLIASSKVYPAK